MGSSNTIFEHHPLGGKLPFQNQESREVVRKAVEGAALLLPNTPIQEARKTDNIYILADGVHGGAVLTKPFTRITGAADTVIDRLLTIKSTAIIKSVKFRGQTSDKDRNNVDQLVLVTAAARVLFQDCVFDKDDVDTGVFVEIEEGGKAEFMGCTFRGGASATAAINNNGVANDVNIGLGYNPTGIAHVAVTSLSEMS